MWHAVFSVFVAACGIFSCGKQTLSCGMWDPVPWSGIKPGPSALGVQSLSHWTTREVPHFQFYRNYKEKRKIPNDSLRKQSDRLRTWGSCHCLSLIFQYHEYRDWLVLRRLREYNNQMWYVFLNWILVWTNYLYGALCRQLEKCQYEWVLRWHTVKELLILSAVIMLFWLYRKMFSV